MRLHEKPNPRVQEKTVHLLCTMIAQFITKLTYKKQQTMPT